MASFFNNFKKQNSSKGFIPKEILDALKEKWNGELEYVYSDNGDYILLPTSEEVKINIKNFNIDNRSEIEEKCNKKNMSFNDFLIYAYNSQKTLNMILDNKEDDHTEIEINGVKVNSDDLFISKHGKISTDNGKLLIRPPKMDNVFNLKIGSIRTSYEFEFEQKPIEDLVKKKFSTTEDSWIHIDFEIDNENMKFYLIIDKDNVINASQYLNALIFINEIYENGMYINDVKIDPDENNKDNGKDIRLELIELWKKICAIESHLNLKFDISKNEISSNEVKLIHILYQTLIENIPIKVYQKINSASFGFSDENEMIFNNFTIDLNENYYFESHNQKEISLFSTVIELYYCVAYFNIHIDRVEKDTNESKYKIHFIENKEEKMYNCSMFFEDSNSLENFIKDENHTNHLKEKAKELIIEKKSVKGGHNAS